MNGLSGSHSSFACSQVQLTALLVFCLVPRRVYVVGIYGSIAKDSKFDWTIQVT